MSRIQRYAIQHALKKPAPKWISSGDANLDAKAVLVGFSGPGSIDYRVVGMTKNAFVASYLEAGGERRDCEIPFTFCKGMHLTIRYWYRGVELKYHNSFHYLWSMVSYEAWRKELQNRFRQFYYNRSLKVRSDRTEILQIIVDEHLRRRSREGAAVLGEIRIDRLEVAQLLYGDGIWGHPQHGEITARLDLIIDSLVEAGDLGADQSRLIVKGRAIASIASRVEEDRRHRDQVGYNTSIKWLTVGLLIAAFAQVLVAYFNSSSN
jgi:hypothetical protein